MTKPVRRSARKRQSVRKESTHPKSVRKKPTHQTTGFKNTLLLVAVSFLSLVLGEVVVRTLYEEPWHQRLIEEQVGRETPDDGHYTLRRDKVVQREPGEFRILFLGDSFTYGHGVEDEYAVFPKLVERAANKELELADIERFEVFNAGLSGSLTGRWIEILNLVEAPFDPDAIIIVFSLRDGTRTSTMGQFFGPIRDEIVEHNEASFFYQNVYLYRLVRDWQDRRLVASRYTETLKQSYFGNESQTTEWRHAQQNLLHIAERAKARSAPVALVVFPILAQLGDDEYVFQDICDEVTSFAERHNIPSLDLLESFRGQNGPDLWVSGFDQHPNEAAHAIAARAIYPFVRELIAGKRGD